jgi:uncharacterized Rmd1/YagE family protein
MSRISSKERRCVSYATATSYPTKELAKAFRNTHVVSTFRDVTFLGFGKDADGIDNGVFLFPYGVVVMWGLTPEEERSLLSDLKPYENGAQESTEKEVMMYAYSGDKLAVIDDCIMLPSTDLRIKLAVSHGLAQSVKLCVFESIVRKTIETTRTIPEHLARYGRIPLSKNEIRKKMGELFIERSSINLHFDVLDVPEYFWEHSELEPTYMVIANHLELETRLEVLNQRLDVIHDLFEVLGNELNHQHSSRLEWIIIFLIVMEVIISVADHIRLFIP